MRILLMVVTVAFCGSGWAVGPDPLAEAWRATDLDLNLSKSFLSNEKCNSNLDYYHSCLAAVQAANALLPTPLHFKNEFLNFENAFAEMAAQLPASVPVQMMLGTAINAHLSLFDAHAYLRPTAVEFNASYAGIGLVARKTHDGFLVTEVVSGSPAAVAKILVGDVLTAVAGIPPADFADETVDDLIDSLSGAPGTSMTLTYRRDGSEKTLTLTRMPVEFKNVTSEVLAADPSIGYIRIRHFNSNSTCSAVHDALSSLDGRNIKKLILDLRGNGGGATQEALCVGGIFIGGQDQVGTQFIGVQIPEKDFVRVRDESSDINWLTGYNLIGRKTPLVVLIDALSASGSEIVAGAVQSNAVGWLVGERSFGKGSVQTVGTVPEHSQLTLSATSARFYFPNMFSNQRVGITPSFAVPIALGLPADQSTVVREAEAYPNALPAVNEPWRDSRQDAIAAIRSCIEKNHIDLQLLKGSGSIAGDYQKAYAAAVLKCSDTAK